jgi:hypothetical protein
MITKRKVLSRMALVALFASMNCVSARPSRNGVFNENQYVRKDFLIRSGTDATSTDPGWFMMASVTAASTPNPLANVGGAGLFPGQPGGGPNFVRFAVTQDKLELIDMREISQDPTTDAQGLRIPSVINVWPISNVDLKYQVNLDGETTNFYQENQELDWQQRQWVKLDFAKNDLSDLAAFYGPLNPAITNCTSEGETVATPIPNSLVIDNDNGYFEFGVQMVIPIKYSADNAAACQQAFGAQTLSNFYRLGRSTVTLNILYSFVRPDKFPQNKLDGSYVPMPVSEKDPIRHKYGAFEFVSPYRDLGTTLLGANQLVTRYDPNKDIIYYFAPGMPDQYKSYFQGANGVEAATNAVLQKAGATGKMRFLNFDDDQTYGDKAAKQPRHIGDVRYSFIIWHTDLDNGSALLGEGPSAVDPRTGQIINAQVNVFEGPFKDTVQQRLDHFLQTVGAEFLMPNGEFDDSKYPASCTDGQTTPLVQSSIPAKLNYGSTVYAKMQAYMQRPVSTYGNLGPANFLVSHDADFYNAYFALIPYITYADPAANPFVSPEGSVFESSMQENWAALQKVAEFEQMAADIDHGKAMFEANADNGVQNSINFSHKFNDLVLAVQNYQAVKSRSPNSAHSDDVGLFSYLDIYQKNGRHCVGGHWESRADYTNRLITSLNGAVALHEFGHTLGLRHNFIGSVDQRNFPKDAQGNVTLFASSIMDYNQAIVEAFFTAAQWPAYDAGALGWIYGNNHDTAHAVAVDHPIGSGPGISQQSNSTTPWNDPLGFQADGTTEIPLLYCSDEHTTYTPLCRRYDMGVTPSEILANEIQQREWNYSWTNFRLYHKYFDLGSYGTGVATNFTEYRRFISMWTYDWSPGELANTLRLVGIKAPQGATAGDYYTQLTNKMNLDISMANQIAASYHRAIIDQASGERPFITVFDPFYGDTTQQGIQIDKSIAISSFSSLWPAISNYDPSQAGGYLLTSAAGQDIAYNSLSNGVLLDFLGAAFATYSYAQVGPIASFAEETHSTMWPGDSRMRSWVGGITFGRERDFLDYVRGVAVKYGFQNCDENGANCQPCTSLDSCSWDPRIRQTKPEQASQSDAYNVFTAADGRTYVWMYLQSRNEWVLADKDRNVAMYTLMFNYTNDVVNAEDDGYDGAQFFETKVRFAIDAFNYFDDDQLSSKN